MVLCISTNLIYDLAWNTVTMDGLVLLAACFLEMLGKLPKRICRTVGPSLAASFEPLTHRRNVANLSLFYRYYFSRCSSEPAQLVLLHYSRGSSTLILIDCMIFPSSFLDVTRMSMSTASFLAHWNFLPVECFPLIYDPNGFKSRINIHLFTVGPF